MSSVENVVLAAPGAIGLAVVIGNEDYTPSPPALELDNLPGAAKDGEAMSQALSRLNFAVHHVKNTTQHTLGQVVYEISCLKHDMVKNYCCIMFVYAGHGCDGDYLRMTNGAKMELGREIIDCLLPGSANELGDIPRVFLIDACRGTEFTDTVLVRPRGRKGSHTVQVAAEGEFLLAYSTLPRCKAFEVEGQGGVWLSTLARLLNQRQHLDSLDTLLARVNGEIKNMQQGGDSFQQPHRQSTVNGIICLDPAAAGAGKGAGAGAGAGAAKPGAGLAGKKSRVGADDGAGDNTDGGIGQNGSNGNGVKPTKPELRDVRTYLVQLSPAQLNDLGVELGLNYPQLQGVAGQDLPREVAQRWLGEQDDVFKVSGTPTWSILVKALRAIGANGVARTIERDRL